MSFSYTHKAALLKCHLVSLSSSFEIKLLCTRENQLNFLFIKMRPTLDEHVVADAVKKVRKFSVCVTSGTSILTYDSDFPIPRCPFSTCFLYLCCLYPLWFIWRPAPRSFVIFLFTSWQRSALVALSQICDYRRVWVQWHTFHLLNSVVILSRVNEWL